MKRTKGDSRRFNMLLITPQAQVADPLGLEPRSLLFKKVTACLQLASHSEKSNEQKANQAVLCDRCVA